MAFACTEISDHRPRVRKNEWLGLTFSRVPGAGKWIAVGVTAKLNPDPEKSHRDSISSCNNNRRY